MQEQRATISIRLKAVLLTGAILTVTFAAVIVFTVESQRRNLRANIEARLSSNTQTLESVLESVMLSGQAEIMNDTLARLREIDDFSELIIYRTDGSRAFGGGATTEAERAATLAMPAMQQALASSEPVQVPSADGTAIEYYSPIVAKDACFECHDPGESIRGVEYFRISMADSLEEIRRSSTLLAGFLLFAAVVTGIAFVMFLGRLVTRPVTQLSQVALSLERGDLTHTVEVRSRDEVGMLSRALATFLRTLNGVVRQVKSMAGRSRTVGNELAAAADNALRTVEEMRGAVGRFAQVVTTLDEEVEQSRASAGDVDSRTTAIVDVIAQQATAIAQASASVEQMTASIEELSRTADTKLAVAVEIGEDADQRQSELERAVAGIKRLAESTSEVQAMITEISDIAAQTDLLAMNAAIEAAHAGEYGRGFAVVADEVRKLSVSSATFARRISETLASVVASIEETERRSLETAAGIRKSAGDIRGVADSLEEIRTANRELAVGSKEVLQALSLLSGSATEVTDSTRSISDRVREIAASLDRLGNTSSAAREGVTNLAAGIEQVHAASNVVAETGRDSAQRAAELDRAVEAFTVTEDDNHATPGGAGGSQNAAAGVRDHPAAAPKPSAGSGANNEIGENREIGENGQPSGAPTAAPPPAQRTG